jgi:alpha-L-fucosidase
MKDEAAKKRYLDSVNASRAKRMQWWHEARFGMFIHWGLYSQIARQEWVMNRERIPRAEYEKFAATWKPKPGAAREWAALAKQAGMKYMVLTTKHHEGFLLWDSKLSDFNAVKCGPGRDLVREYVDAAREFGLKVGFYYSLMDWHHPDGHACARDEKARKRFTAYTRGLVRELCSNYGKIDILWYDVPWPLNSPEAWESYDLNQMVRRLQPQIIINDRSQLPEDLGTPEEHISAAEGGRAWEACMTFNGSWGWQPCPPEDWHSVRKVLDMLRQVSAGCGNLLLNIGPLPDGSVPREAVERLQAVGRWMDTYGSVIYGHVDRVANMEWFALGNWTRKGNTLYFWCSRWPGKELAMGGIRGELKQARLLADGRTLPFTQEPDRLVIRGLPEQCPDTVAQVAVIEMEFAQVPRQKLWCGCEPVEDAVLAAPVDPKWGSPFISEWKVSLPRPLKGNVRPAKTVRLKDALGWQTIKADGITGFVNVHAHYPLADGLVYFLARVKVARSGTWIAHIGHDGGAKMFIDGKSVYCNPTTQNPARPDRAQVPVTLAKGTHEILLAFDLDETRGWGIHLNFSVPEDQRTGAGGVFPEGMTVS